MKNIPKHLLRFRSQPISIREKIAKAQKQSENQRPKAKITLKQPPWVNQGQTTNQS